MAAAPPADWVPKATPPVMRRRWESVSGVSAIPLTADPHLPIEFPQYIIDNGPTLGEGFADASPGIGHIVSVTAGVGLTGGGATSNINIALETPVSLAHGGTGATSAGSALIALGAAPIDSPIFIGDARAVTPPLDDHDNSIATTEWVKNQNYTVSGLFAPINSPVFIGDPQAPNPPLGDNDTSIATTKWVKDQGYASGGPFAPITSPVFLGDPQAPTPMTSDSDFSIATTGYVKAQGYIAGNQAITISGDATGTGTTAIALTVTGLQGRPVAATAPVLNQILQWSGSAWTPSAPVITVADSPPAGPIQGAGWWDSNDGQLYIWYNDGTSAQWVPASNQPGIGTPVTVAQGGTGTGTPFASGSIVFAGSGGVYTSDSANLFWDDTANRLGIGTATPSTALEVIGTTKSTGIHVHSSVDNNLLLVSPLTLSSGISVRSITDNFGTYQPLEIIAAPLFLNTAAGGVGVGITAPDRSMVVHGAVVTDGASKSQLKVSSSAAYNASPTAGISFGVFWTSANNAANGCSIQGIKENATDGDYAQAMLFTTQANGPAPAERMRITSGGNVGIGTASPRTALDVNGGIIAAGPLPTVTTGLGVSLEISGGVGYLTARNFATSTNVDFTTFTNTFNIVPGAGVSSALFVAANGNVGIGTTTPNAKLTFTANTFAGGFLSAYSRYQLIYADGGTAGASYGTGVDAAGIIVHNTGNAFRWDLNGNATYALFDPGGTSNISGAWLVLSDRSLKEEIQPYTRGLEAITQLSPVQFRYIKGSPFASTDAPSRPLMGLIADEVEPHVPEIVGEMTAAVGEKSDVTIATLAPGLLVFALINSVKTLAEQNTALSARLEVLEARP